jgi:hypothetical protein
MNKTNQSRRGRIRRFGLFNPVGTARYAPIVWLLCLGAASTAVGENGPALPTINVSVASWGYGAERVNVAEDVSKLCQGKPSCAFTVNNEVFGDNPDPSPGNSKGLIVAWKCVSGNIETEHKYQFAEGKTAKLGCS